MAASETVPLSLGSSEAAAENEAASFGDAVLKSVGPLTAGEGEAEALPAGGVAEGGALIKPELVPRSESEGCPRVGDGEGDTVPPHADAEGEPVAGALPRGEALTRALAVPLAPEAVSEGEALGEGVAQPVKEGVPPAEGVCVARTLCEGDPVAEAEAEGSGEGLAGALAAARGVSLAQLLSLGEPGGESLGSDEGEGTAEEDAEGQSDGAALREGEPLTEGEAAVDPVGVALTVVPFRSTVGVAALPECDGRALAESDLLASGERVAARAVTVPLFGEAEGLAETRRALPVGGALPADDRDGARGVPVAFAGEPDADGEPLGVRLAETLSVPVGAPLTEGSPLPDAEKLPLRLAPAEALSLRLLLALPEGEGVREGAPVALPGMPLAEAAPVGVGAAGEALAAPGEAEDVPVTARGSVVPEAVPLRASLAVPSAPLPVGGALAGTLMVPGGALPVPAPPALALAVGAPRVALRPALALAARVAAAEPLAVPLAVAVIVADACTRTACGSGSEGATAKVKGNVDSGGKSTLATQQLYAAATVHAAGPSAPLIRNSDASRTNTPEPERCRSVSVAAPKEKVPLVYTRPIESGAAAPGAYRRRSPPGALIVGVCARDTLHARHSSRAKRIKKQPTGKSGSSFGGVKHTS